MIRQALSQLQRMKEWLVVPRNWSDALGKQLLRVGRRQYCLHRELLLVTLQPHEFGSDHPLAGVELQRRYEAAAFRLGRGTYYTPIQSVADFLAGRSPSVGKTSGCSYQRGVIPAAFDELLPSNILAAIRTGLPIMDRSWQGEFLRHAILVGPEMRGSSPVRIARDNQSRETPGCTGLFPVGEGAGYADGIISAAVDGLRSAKAVVGRFAFG